MKYLSFPRCITRISLIVSLSSVFGLLHPIRAQTFDMPSFSLSNFDQYKEEIVAKIGNFNLSAQEFLFNYEFGPAYLKRTSQSKKKYLNIMIYEKLLAIDGYNKEIDQRESVVRSCKAYEEDIMTEELFKDEVMSEVFVTDEEIENELPLEQKHLSFRWLYSKNKSELIWQWNALGHGITFDSLFYLQLNDSVPLDDRSMKSSYLRLKLKNPVLAAIVDTIGVGICSNPIKTADGWYIFKIDNIWTNVIATESEIGKLKNEIERAIFSQKLNIASESYVKDLMDLYSPEIDRETFREVVNYINETALYPKSYDQLVLEKHLGFETHNNHSYSGQMDEKNILVRGISCQILFTDFIDWYRPRMAYLKFSSESAQRFILSVQETVWRMVRDFLLVQRARKLNIDKRESVTTQVKWWQDKIVFNAVKADIATSIIYDDNDLENYYKINIKDYIYQDGRTIPFEKAMNNVRSDYISENYTSQLMRRILKLKQEYEIIINESVLDDIKVTDEANPITIDLYAVKKGGLLPRQPYPTIDWEWQLWH
jgi:hypothetical protein